MIILHDSNGRPYYEAIEWLLMTDFSCAEEPLYYESSVFKLFLKAVLLGDFQRNSLRRLAQNLVFRFRVPFIRNEIIILGMGPYDFRLIWYSLLLRKNKVIFHSSWPYWGGDIFPRNYYFLNPLVIRFWKKIMSNPKLTIVAVTDKVEKSLKEFCDIRGEIRVIPHCVNTQVFKPKPCGVNINKRLGVLFVGKMIKAKGLDTLAEVIKKADPEYYRFGIVGSGSYSSYFEDVFCKENVRYYGFVKEKERLASIYRNYDILLVPSLRTQKWEELFGIVIIEAMNSGLVVIASDHTGPSEIIQDGVNGLLVPEAEPNTIIEKLDYLLHSPTDRTKISRYALERAKQFSVDKIAAQWQRVLFP